MFAVHVGPADNARLDAVAVRVLAHDLGHSAASDGRVHGMRARTDQTHVSAQDIDELRQVVEALKASGAEEVVQPKTSLRPWGSWTSLLSAPRYQIKIIEVKPGSRLSLQKHHHRSEHWIVVSGTAVVTRDDERIEVHANESIFLPVGCVHRLENCGKVPLQLIEVQVGEYLGEDDIVRLDDDWSRES